ncbi:MAG: class I SAM-dependent methyltransferase [Methanothrix sp.]|nr:class I SAM-dependent methyltransferase [Methanothrix sp.]
MAEPLTEMEYAECFNAFKKVSTEWMAIKGWLSDDFIPSLAGRKSANILSIGSGTGDFDLTLMRMLLGKIPTLSYIALDPNVIHNDIFLKKYKESELNISSFQIIAQPFSEDLLGGGFDLIHLTHCLYYIPDRKMAIRKAYDMLNPGGILLIFHQTPLGINEIRRLYLTKVKGDDKEIFSSYDILLIMKELGLKFNFNILISDIDVTDCIAGTDTGRRILSFFLESNIEGLDQTQYNQIIQTLKEICRCQDGRYFLFHPSGIFWIRKPL